MLRVLIQSHPEWDVCGEAANGRDALDKARELKPDVVLLDINMPCLTGLEASPIIHKELPQSEIVIVAQHESRELSRLAQKAGARGYIAKSDIARDLVPALEAARKRRPQYGAAS
jgi:DNA-binding NarL/FixJ family response regulator